MSNVQYFDCLIRELVKYAITATGNFKYFLWLRVRKAFTRVWEISQLGCFQEYIIPQP